MTFANHLGLALERAQLRQTALHVGNLEEVDRLRQSLVGAVSHDLRTPLATIKIAVSSLRDARSNLSNRTATRCSHWWRARPTASTGS